MSKSRNIWVFGGTGFIGESLVSHLKTNPDNRLNLLVHKRIPYRKLEDLNTFTGDISTFDPAWFRRYPPQIVFHLARISGSNYISRRFASENAFKANTRMVEILSSLPDPPIVVYVSGSLMYGSQDNNTPANEFTPLRPLAFAKYIIPGEQPWLEAQQRNLLDVRFARPAWVVGTKSWFREFFWNVFRSTGKVPYYGSGDQLMSLISTEDCARLIDELSRSGNKGQNLNVFTGEPLTQLQFAEIAASYLNAGVLQIKRDDVKHWFGVMVADALTSSIPLSTQYPDIYRNANILTSNAEEIISNTLILLQNE